MSLYEEYLLENAPKYIECAKTKDELQEVVQNLYFEDVIHRNDIIQAFNNKAQVLGIDEDKLFSWIHC